MKIVATFSEIEDKQIQDLINTFKSQSANIRIIEVNQDGTVDIGLILIGCQLEDNKGIELKSKLFKEIEENSKDKISEKDIKDESADTNSK